MFFFSPLFESLIFSSTFPFIDRLFSQFVLSYPICVPGDYEAAIREHQQELSLSEVLNDVIGRAVANRKIGECYAEIGNIEDALKVSRLFSFFFFQNACTTFEILK